MRAVTAALVALLVATAGCGTGGQHVRTLRLLTADPAGAEHDPALLFFAQRVALLSHGRLRIVIDDRLGHEGEPRESSLIAAVAHGRADLGFAHTRFVARAGARRLEALDVPGLIDRYELQAALIESPLGSRLLAATRAAGVEGLALLAGRLAHPVGTRRPVRSARDIVGREVGLRAWRPNEHYHRGSLLPALALHALGAYPRPLTYERLFGAYVTSDGVPGRPSVYEDDLDALFFDRYGERCRAPDAACRTLGPWVTVDLALWPRTAAIVAGSRVLARLTPRERGWLRAAAAAASRRSLAVGAGDQRLLDELCAAGVRAAAARPRAVAELRRRVRAASAGLGDRRTIEAIERLRRRTAPDRPLRVPPGCGRRHAHDGPARGMPSPLRAGVYRAQITKNDLRAAGATAIGDRAGIATLTLRGGRWGLAWSEPRGRGTGGTYAGAPLRTAWSFGRGEHREEAYMSIAAAGDGALRFTVARADDLPHLRAIFASHPWRRIGS